MASETHIVVPVTLHEKALLSDILVVEAAQERLRGGYAIAGTLYSIAMSLNDPNYVGLTEPVNDELKVPLSLVCTLANIVEKYIDDFESHAHKDAQNYRTLVSQTVILKDLLYKLDHS